MVTLTMYDPGALASLIAGVVDPFSLVHRTIVISLFKVRAWVWTGGSIAIIGVRRAWV